MPVKIAIVSIAFALVLMTVPNLALAQDNPDDSMQMVTGCLQKGSGPNSYTLTDDNGKLWDVHSKTVRFGPHVGHTVTLTGTIPEKSKENRSSGDTSPQNHLDVTDLKMVSDHCESKN